MKNRIFNKILFFILFFIIINNCRETNKINANVLNLSKEILINTKWGKENSPGTLLVFNKNGTLSLEISAFGSIKYTGIYRIENNKLITNFDTIKSDKTNMNPKLAKENIWLLQEDKESLFYTKKIISSNGFEYYDLNSKVKEGEKRRINNVDVIIVEEKIIELIYNTKIRKKPSIKSEEIIFNDIDGDISYMPKGKKIQIIARNLTKEKIQDWNNYWYYCKIYDWFPGFNKYGWVYGGVIDLE